MKYSLYLTGAIAALIIGFFVSTCHYPHFIGWQGEVAVGYYRFKIVTYDITDYGHKNNVEVIEILDDSINSFKFLFNRTNLELTR